MGGRNREVRWYNRINLMQSPRMALSESRK